jgi:hypothetical protein
MLVAHTHESRVRMKLQRMQPHSVIRLEIPTHSFSSEEAVAEHLIGEDQPDDARFLYRGQAREYRRRWPLTDGPFRDLVDSDLVDRRCWVFQPTSLAPPIPLRRGTMDLPSLIPTNTCRPQGSGRTC